MTKIIEGTIQTSGGDYFLNPNFGEHEDMDLAGWIAQGEENGYTVTENTELDGRVQGQNGGKVFHCAMSEDEYVDVVVWEA